VLGGGKCDIITKLALLLDFFITIQEVERGRGAYGVFSGCTTSTISTTTTTTAITTTTTTTTTSFSGSLLLLLLH